MKELFMRRPWLPTVALITTLVLSACGGSIAQQPTAEPQPTTRPHSTARPAASEQPTAEPVEELGKMPATEPTRDTGPQVTATVDMDDFQTYSYKTGLFSIDVPASWSSQVQPPRDRSILVQFEDKTKKAFVLVILAEAVETMTEEQLTERLNVTLDGVFGKRPNFSHQAPKKQVDGSLLVVWGYDRNDGNGNTARLLGNSFIEQRGNVLSL